MMMVRLQLIITRRYTLIVSTVDVDPSILEFIQFHTMSVIVLENAIEGSRNANVVDTTVPLISIIGDLLLYRIGETFNDPGATAVSMMEI